MFIFRWLHWWRKAVLHWWKRFRKLLILPKVMIFGGAWAQGESLWVWQYSVTEPFVGSTVSSQWRPSWPQPLATRWIYRKERWRVEMSSLQLQPEYLMYLLVDQQVDCLQFFTVSVHWTATVQQVLQQHNNYKSFCFFANNTFLNAVILSWRQNGRSILCRLASRNIIIINLYVSLLIMHS